MASRTVGPDEFRDALRPLVEALREFSAAVDAVAPRHGRTPWEDSPAMREIADEHRYSGPSGWDQPIHDTHMLGDLTLRAAADYVRTFAEAFMAERAPVYGHLVVARAALESSAVCAWLSEPGIARDARVKRGLSDFLYTAVEDSRLKIRDDDESVKVWIDRASKLGWQATDYNGKAWSDKSRGKPVVDGVGRPSTGAGITRLLVSDGESKVGQLLWSRLSAVSHVTFFGLRWALMLETREDDSLSGLATVAVGTDSTGVYTQAFCILKALRKAASAHFELMDWQDDEWLTAAGTAERHERGLIDAIRVASSDWS